jgi:hypothetical protein
MRTYHVAADGALRGPGDLALELHGVGVHVQQARPVRQDQLPLL